MTPEAIIKARYGGKFLSEGEGRKNRNEKSGIYCAYLLKHLPRILSIASGSCEPSH